MFFEVAIPTQIFTSFLYEAEEPILPGTRVLVPFGKRKTVGVVIKEVESKLTKDLKFTIKKIEEIIDPIPIFTPPLLQLADFISSYYIHPLGNVLRTMLPASILRSKQGYISLTERGKAALGTKSCQFSLLLEKVFQKKDILPLKSFFKKADQLKNDLPAFGEADLRLLCEIGYLTRTERVRLKTRKSEKSLVPDQEIPKGTEEKPGAALPLTKIQEEVLDFILKTSLSSAEQQKPFLLHGITGSGKTEIYLQLIAKIISFPGEPCQTLVLVPEISLTPQMTKMFNLRFPGKIAVVHSAMTDAERWDQLEKIRFNTASVLIGPRSAVFGPFSNLKLIIVDEEHDGSYKQTTGLPYNARDIAVMRAKIEGASVILGSATPSLESYHNALAGKYHLLRMPERVSGAVLPDVETVSAKPSHTRGFCLPDSMATDFDKIIDENIDLPIDPRIIEELSKNLQEKRQSMVLINRRGFAYYLLSLKNKKAVTCPHCSISLTLHKKSRILRCHYCDYRTTLADIQQIYPDESFVAVGYGSEKAEQYLKKALPGASICRLDSDTVAKRDVLADILSRFRKGEIDILVGTQILAKGHDFPNVTLIVILEVDQLLNLPDFRAGEKTFQLLVQAAGRAGRAMHPGKVLVQSLKPSHPVVQFGLQQDYEGFVKNELEFRKAFHYPPFFRCVSLEFNHRDRDILAHFSSRLTEWVNENIRTKPEIMKSVKIFGPTIPPLETIRLKHRRTILLLSKNSSLMRQIITGLTQYFEKDLKKIDFRVDVDPQNLC